MPRFAAILAATLAASLPAAVAAEPVVLRIEAKRGSDTQAAATGWAAKFPNVVIFPLPGGWTGIGLGPVERAEAEAELTRLKAAGEIPDDSFLSPVPANVTSVAGTVAEAQPDAQPADQSAAGAAAGASTFVPPSGNGGTAGNAGGDAAATTAPAAADAADVAATSTDTAASTDAAAAPTPGSPDESGTRPETTLETTPEMAPAAPADNATGDAAGTSAAASAETSAAAPADSAASASTPSADASATPSADTPPPGDFLRLQRFETRDAADEALTRWREDFPETGLWQQPDGGFALALGPMPAATAEAWLAAFRRAERVGRPAAILPAADLGTALDAGTAPDLPGPGTAAMPPLIDIQRALRWAGHYSGKIDGKDGPQTQAAIAAEVLTLRAAPDAASAMQALIDRRAEWNAEMGLTRLDDPQTGLSVMAPMDRLVFDRTEQGLSIYGPKDDSGAALILYSAPGGQQEMLDFAGLVTALGWVPSPERQVDPGHAALKGRNATHIGQAEARVSDGRVEGLVLIWPVMDEADQPRIAAEAIDSLTTTAAATEAEAGAEAGAGAEAAPEDAAAGAPGDSTN